MVRGGKQGGVSECVTGGNRGGSRICRRGCRCGSKGCGRDYIGEALGIRGSMRVAWR